MILNPRGQLIWFHPLTNAVPANLEAQTYRGMPVLTWWQGSTQAGHGITGEDMIVNNSYKLVAMVRPGWGYLSDQHDFQITPRGTALVDAYVPVKADLSSVGGPASGAVVDCVVQELDVRTGTVLWEWHTLGHVPLSESYSTPGSSGDYDAFHLNSVQQLPGHRLLISLRNTSAVYEVDELTGRVIWTLGGKDSSFWTGRGAGFEWQHDAHLQDHGLLTLFDDAAAPQEEPQSSAKELRIDSTTGTVSLVHRYTHSPSVLAGSQGSAQLLADRDVFVGWGSQPDFSEYAPGGRVVFNATFALTNASYRAYRSPWTGRPRTRPALAMSWAPSGRIHLYVSWNGATQVASWRVVGGSGPRALTPLQENPWSGFETAIALHRTPRYVAAQALDAGGRVIGQSRTVAATTAG
jgi:hypothetical protein